MRKVKSKVGDAWHKVSINPKAMVKVERGTAELNETFNNPRLVLMNLCYATMAVWSVYDEVSTMASKNRLVLTGKERKTIRNVDSALLDCYMNLSGLMDTRLKEISTNRDMLKRHDAEVKYREMKMLEKEVKYRETKKLEKEAAKKGGAK